MVNWTRRKSRWRALEMVLTRRVFGQPRHAFEEEVSGGQESNQGAFHDNILSHDNAADAFANFLKIFGGSGEG